MAHRWQQVVHRFGGTVADIAIAEAANGQCTVFAATPAGVFRSSTERLSWSAAIQGSDLHFAESVSPSPNYANDLVVFAGTKTGVYRSDDGGETWFHMLSGGAVTSIVLSPSFDRDRLVFVGTETDGILQSSDGGTTWNRINPGLLDHSVRALALSPQFERDRTGFAATGVGVFRTRNGGAAWRAANFLMGESPVQCLAVSPCFTNDQTVMAGTESDGLLVSRNAGKTWDPIWPLVEGSVLDVVFSRDYPDDGTILASTDVGIALSHDYGETWSYIAKSLEPALSMGIVNQDSGMVILAGLIRDGVALSNDMGESWMFANDGLSARLLTCLTFSPGFERDQTIFTAGLFQGVTKSVNGGTVWKDCSAGLANTQAVQLLTSPSPDGSLFALTAAGLYQSRDMAESWAMVGKKDDWTGVQAVAIGPPSDEGTMPILTVSESGDVWLANGESARQLLGKPFGQDEVVRLEFSPNYHADLTIWAGSMNKEVQTGTLWCSTDGGRSWEAALAGRAQQTLPFAVTSTSPTYAEVFIGLGERVVRLERDLDRAHPEPWGSRWRNSRVEGGTVSITSIAVSPDYIHDSSLWVSSNRGVYISRDAGKSFHPWRDGLDCDGIVATVPSPSYAHDRLVFALAYGGAIWRRFDMQG